MTRRIQRVNELLRQEISLVVQRRLKDPRTKNFISIVKVETSPDLTTAKVFVSVLGSYKDQIQALEGLISASRFIRKTIGDIVSLRLVPNLEFKLEDPLEKGAKVLQVMEGLKHNEDN
jgi:ribosome-binding factor A|tara:strand:- start:327 stop:680 length:354 start_codon:yes stop_codon:yes gene_type:complete